MLIILIFYDITSVEKFGESNLSFVEKSEVYKVFGTLAPNLSVC